MRDASVRPEAEQDRQLLLQQASAPSHVTDVIRPSFDLYLHTFCFSNDNCPCRHPSERKTETKGGKRKHATPSLLNLWVPWGNVHKWRRRFHLPSYVQEPLL